MPAFTIKKDLVSIITPCYNGANLIHRLLDSALLQDYPFVQMIVVDDGSTDKSKEVILSYKNKFEEKGYSLTYIYQKNAGQAAAINNALKYVEGEYLCWPDCDDFYNSPVSISKFVRTLKNTDETYAIARTIGHFLNEKDFKPLVWNINWVKGENLFEACLFGTGFLMVPINYMVKMVAFDIVNPIREIYTGRYPQNFQMFEPILYSYKCVTIDEPLCNVIVRNDSDSHSKKTYSQQMDDLKGYLDIQLNTLDRIEQIEETRKIEYIKRVESHLYGEQLSLALRNYAKEDSKKIMEHLKQIQQPISYKRIIKYYILNYCSSLLRIIDKIILMINFVFR